MCAVRTQVWNGHVLAPCRMLPGADGIDRRHVIAWCRHSISVVPFICKLLRSRLCSRKRLKQTRMDGMLWLSIHLRQSNDARRKPCFWCFPKKQEGYAMLIKHAAWVGKSSNPMGIFGNVFQASRVGISEDDNPSFDGSVKRCFWPFGAQITSALGFYTWLYPDMSELLTDLQLNPYL